MTVALRVVVFGVLVSLASACVEKPPTAQERYCDAMRRAVAEGERIDRAAPEVPYGSDLYLMELQVRMHKAERELEGTSTPPSVPGVRVASGFTEYARVALSRAEDDEFYDTSGAAQAAAILGELQTHLLDRLQYCRGRRLPRRAGAP